MKNAVFTAVVSVAGLAAAPAHAALQCESGQCTLDLATVVVTFAQDAFQTLGYLNIGNDGYVSTSPGFPALTEIQDGGRAGFSFNPGLSAFVGGSGINGYHEAFGSFDFNGVTFTAKPGYQVLGIEFTVGGELSTVGNGSVYVNAPGIPEFNGGAFTYRAQYGSGGEPGYHVDFTAGASYLEGEDGTAADYGTASVWFSSGSLVALTAPVPEPEAWLLMAGGLAVLGWQMRRQRVG